MALLEAMSCGLPVVVSSAGGNPEIVDHDVNGLLFEPESNTQLEHALRKLANAPDLLEKMSRNNAAKMREDYTWESVAAKYEVVYKRVLIQAEQDDGQHSA
jgi:glycosyltransferase involved in cell wall biosynthesis